MEAESPQEKTVVETPQANIEPREVLRRLQEISPTFRDCKPLALGIDKAIQARYLKALEKATERFDLDGNVDGEITEEHRSHASQTLKERFAAAAKRKREQEKAARAQEREEASEQRKAERLQQLVGKFSKR